MTPEGKTVLVLGLGESGLAMAQWLYRRGARVRVADTRAEPPFAAELKRSAPAVQLVTGAFGHALLDGLDSVALSPGLALSEPVVIAAAARGIPVVGEIELFARALRELGVRDSCKVVAITGTNGKTTTTSMVGAMGRAAGKLTAVAGNIGPAALSALMTCLDAGKLPELWVLELSSFQLETTASLDADAALVLNVSDDHLDRYAGLDDYAAAKARIFDGRGAQVLNRQDARVLAMARSGRPVFTFGLDAPPGERDFGLIEGWLASGSERLIRVEDLAVSGLHNAANALASLALCRAVGLPLAPVLQALRGFRGLPHRTEKIAEIDGVAWYDDSKGTNVGATVAALEGLGGQPGADDRNNRNSHLPPSGREAGREAGREGPQSPAPRPTNKREIFVLARGGGQGGGFWGRGGGRGRGARPRGGGGARRPPRAKQHLALLVVILGGDGKGQDFSPLGPALASHGRALVLIGRDAARIEAAVAGCGVAIIHAPDMDQAVRQAAAAARAGDAVLLSPACASFDMFRNYAHRAEVFAQAVRALAASRQGKLQ